MGFNVFVVFRGSLLRDNKSIKMKTVKKTDFGFCMIVVVYWLPVLLINRMRVFNYNSVGVKVGVLVYYRILGNKKMNRYDQ